MQTTKQRNRLNPEEATEEIGMDEERVSSGEDRGRRDVEQERR